MERNSGASRTAQLDAAEREHLETVVTEMRDRAEANVRYQLEGYDLGEEPDEDASLSDEEEAIVEAIELRAVDGTDWAASYEQYVTGVGYTIVNRLAALRCMEVRDFVDEEVTAFREGGLTPAAARLVDEEFMLEAEAVLEAYRNACDALAEEIEILFDRSTAYSLVDPDADAFEALCGMLDEVPDAAWRADDVLGWVYEYYNRPVVEALDAKNTLGPKDIGPANQFYTPHWVVRMLADNGLGKLYLESMDRLSSVPARESLSPAERKTRETTPTAAPDVASLCTYLIPDGDAQRAPSFDDPSEIRVLDPACGSGHFLLYAFDILERIWWNERPDLDRGEIPEKILEHNLYGVDIDLRSCQLAAFNLYLKARERAETEGNDSFELPDLGIVCADARIATLDAAEAVFDEITEDREVRASLQEVRQQFQDVEALGSLLDVRGAISGEFSEEQASHLDSREGTHRLNVFLSELRSAVDERTSDSFAARNLRSFLRLLVVLTRDYDVALMNPPYGSGGRMPDEVQTYVDECGSYEYATEYYINFFEVCDRLVAENGRIGMLVPRSFMFNRTFQGFREDFVGGRGSFDFFAEFGYGVLDNATVGTVGTVVRSGTDGDQTGTFVRLADVEKAEMEVTFLRAAFVDEMDGAVQRRYECDLSEFDAIPGTPLSYWVPDGLRGLYDSESVLDAANAGVDRDSFGTIKQGLATADDGRFVRSFWEASDADAWPPFAKGGADAWILPRVKETVLWEDGGTEVERYGGSRPQNTRYYFEESLTYTVAKRSGRRFGYLHDSSVFGHKGSVLVPDRAVWNALSYTNSRLFTYLMLCQTSERMWEVGFVSKVPWREELEGRDELAALSREAVTLLVSKRQHDFVSPYYSGPALLAALGASETLPQYDHPHRDLRNELEVPEPRETLDPGATLSELAVTAATHLERVEADLQACSDAIDEAVFDCFDIDDGQRETVLQEIALRTIGDPREREEYDPAAITEPTDEFPELVADLLLHLTIKIVREDDDGIVPVSEVRDENDLLARLEDEFGRLFGEYAADRLAEVDRVLGTRSAAEEAYPNLRAWLENDLFRYHVAKFERTPILWRLTTRRLVPDPVGDGFACLVDYHQVDANLFDRLQNRYLEPRKALLRERRRAANERRTDAGLSPSEQADATEAFERCDSGLQQIDEFEAVLGELSDPSPRAWSAANRELAEGLQTKVRRFREETEANLDALDELAALEDVDVAVLFSETFYDRVNEHRDEWIGGLEDLERACDAYTRPGTEPVAAHLYDLFSYFEHDLLGSVWPTSTGISLTTYYFEDIDASGRDLTDARGSKRERLLAGLAEDADVYRELGEEIAEDCNTLSKEIPSDWNDRALSEITTAGYQPNQKHGVAINITPLAERSVVPDIVEDNVL